MSIRVGIVGISGRAPLRLLEKPELSFEEHRRAKVRASEPDAS